jgi:RHS repeat-associated protein
MAYDALNRPVAVTTPDGSVCRPVFNEGGLLETLDVNLQGAALSTRLVQQVDYNARGQRTRVEHGNGAVCEYDYDPTTGRLKQLTTARAGRVLQDVTYTYDAVGNVTEARDAAQQTIYFDNQVVEPHNRYSYDAIYRLIAAEGREHVGQLSSPATSWDDRFRVRQPHPGNGQAMRRYTERYEHDACGNFLTFVHLASNGNWTRHYRYEHASLLEPGKIGNRLSATQVGSDEPEAYPHDSHGNILAMPHLSEVVWDYKDQLQSIDLAGGGEAHYVYDAAGQRVRKVIERIDSGLVEERIYLSGFEVFRRRQNGVLSLERQTLHVMDDTRRVAIFETRTHGADGAASQLARYQFSNLQHSACLELDGAGQIISYEEYYPFGSTSYQAVASQVETPKRYRHTGIERDDESGLQYHNHRYYAPWLGRWLNADPIGTQGGMNVFCYCRQNPVGSSDPSGLNPENEPTREDYRKFNRWIDTNHDRTITLKEFVDGLGCQLTITASGWFGHMAFSGGDYRISGDLQQMAAVYRDAAMQRQFEDAQRAYEQSETVARMHTDGIIYTNREGREATKRRLNRHRDPNRVIVTAAVGAAIVFPEATAVVMSFDTGVKIGETATGTRSGARVEDVLTLNFGVAGTPMSDEERAQTGAQAALGIISMGLTALTTTATSTGIGATRIRTERVSPFNQTAGGAGMKNCVRCVTSLIDSIENGSFVAPASQYSARASFPTATSALEYISEQTGVTFGTRLRGTLGGPGDYAVFNQFKDGRPTHILWARVRPDGTSSFYDPQIARKVTERSVGPYEAYQVQPGQ